MSIVTCPECAMPYDSSLAACPECACPNENFRSESVAAVSAVACVECGCPLSADDLVCPECGCPNDSLNTAVRAELEAMDKADRRELKAERQKIAQLRQSVAKPEFVDPTLSLVRTLKHVFANCDNFTGRSRRAEFWTFVAFNCMMGFVLYMAMFASIGRDYITISAATTATEYWQLLIYSCFTRHLFVTLLTIIYLLLISLPLLAVTVRRLHDTNHSGLWLFAAIVPFIFGLSLNFCPYYGVLFLSIILLLDGVGDNKWGMRIERN